MVKQSPWGSTTGRFLLPFGGWPLPLQSTEFFASYWTGTPRISKHNRSTPPSLTEKVASNNSQDATSLSTRPTSHRTQLQDGHPFDRRILRPPLRIDAVHPGSDNSQFFTQQNYFGFQPVDLRLTYIALLDEKLTATQHGKPHDADNIQHCMSNGYGPVFRQGQGLDIPFT